MDTTSVFQLIITGSQILQGEMCHVRIQYDHKVDIRPIHHFVNHNLDCHFHSGQCDLKDLFKG